MALSCVIMGAADWELVSKRGSVILHGSCHHWIKTILRMVFATATREVFLCFYNTTTLLRNYPYIDNFIFQYELSTLWSDLVGWAGLSPLVQSRLDSDRPARASWSLTQPLETLESRAASQTTELVAAILTESCFTPAVSGNWQALSNEFQWRIGVTAGICVLNSGLQSLVTMWVSAVDSWCHEVLGSCTMCADHHHDRVIEPAQIYCIGSNSESKRCLVTPSIKTRHKYSNLKNFRDFVCCEDEIWNTKSK